MVDCFLAGLGCFRCYGGILFVVMCGDFRYLLMVAFVLSCGLCVWLFVVSWLICWGLRLVWLKLVSLLWFVGCSLLVVL